MCRLKPSSVPSSLAYVQATVVEVHDARGYGWPLCDNPLSNLCPLLVMSLRQVYTIFGGAGARESAVGFVGLL